MPRLIAFAGLPGTGKSTLARELARRTGALWLRIDSLEQAIRASGVAADGDLRDAGYRAAYAVAQDNLALGRDFIADCVNPWKLTRDAWQDIARAAQAEVIWIETTCSDPAEHRRRVETRTPDIPGTPSPPGRRSSPATTTPGTASAWSWIRRGAAWRRAWTRRWRL